jgi:phage terminase Nu1 subunit (DNA packaging protein)
MWFNKKKEEPKVEAKDTVIQIDPMIIGVKSGPTPEQMQQAAMYPNLNAVMVDRIKQSIARAEKKGHGDHEVVKNLKEELVWREKLLKAGV